jgi:hypothetical protein
MKSIDGADQRQTDRRTLAYRAGYGDPLFRID